MKSTFNQLNFFKPSSLLVYVIKQLPSKKSASVKPGFKNVAALRTYTGEIYHLYMEIAPGSTKYLCLEKCGKQIANRNLEISGSIGKFKPEQITKSEIVVRNSGMR